MDQTPNNDEIALARKVAWRAAAKWRGVDADDVTSHLFLWMCENTRYLREWRQDDGNGRLYVSLRREAAKFCAAEQANRVNRPIDEDNFYTPEVVARALPFVFEGVPQNLATVNPTTGEAVGRVEATSRAQVIILDIGQAYNGLPAELREVLAWRFCDGLTFEEIGELRSLTKDGAKKQVDRAVRRLCDVLVGQPPIL